MDIIDAQLHDIGPRLDWRDADQAVRFDILTEVMLAWMDAVGISKTLLHPMNPDWAKQAIARHPDRFAGVYRARDSEAPDIHEQVEACKSWPGMVGLRVSFGKRPTDPSGASGAAKFASGAFDGFFAACAKSRIPVFCSAYGYVHLVGKIAAAHPELQLIVDHMGIAQPPLNPRETPPWKSLPELLKLATFANVAVKMCGVPVLSEESYPFRDVWPYVHKLIAAFGVDRLLWASDIGRFVGRVGWDNEYDVARGDYPGKHNLAESLYFILGSDELSSAEKAAILGGSARKLLGLQ